MRLKKEMLVNLTANVAKEVLPKRHDNNVYDIYLQNLSDTAISVLENSGQAATDGYIIAATTGTLTLKDWTQPLILLCTGTKNIQVLYQVRPAKWDHAP